MTAYLNDLSSLLRALVNQLSYVGSHLDNYPLLGLMIGVWVIIAAVSLLFALSNN